jgi:hypothetical protein
MKKVWKLPSFLYGLETAQPTELNDLNNNIKCGNSLIDDVEIAGNRKRLTETAFRNLKKVSLM